MTRHEINSEVVNDRAKLMIHRLIARLIAQDPDLIEAAKLRLTDGPRSLTSNHEWLEILNREPGEVRRMITSRSDKMTRLRISSPFSLIVEIRDPVLRKRIWKAARRGASAKTCAR